MGPDTATNQGWRIEGSANPTVLAAGHSHVIALLSAVHQGLVPDGCQAAVAMSDGSGDRALGGPGYWDDVVAAAAGRHVALVWNGNQHNASFLIQPDPPITVAHPRVPVRASVPASRVIPRMMLRDYWRWTNEGLESVVQRLSAVARGVLVLGTPPPKPDRIILQALHTEPLFAERAQSLGLDPGRLPLTDGPSRRALWWVVQDMLAESAERTGARFVPVPDAAFDDDGFLREDLSTADATHANHEFGALMWTQVANVTETSA